MRDIVIKQLEAVCDKAYTAELDRVPMFLRNDAQSELELANDKLVAFYKEATTAINDEPDDTLTTLLHRMRPFAIAAAVAVGSTDEADAYLTKIVNQWVDSAINMVGMSHGDLPPEPDDPGELPAESEPEEFG